MNVVFSEEKKKKKKRRYGGVGSPEFYEIVSGAVPFLLLVSNRVSIDPEHLRCLSG